MRDSKVVILLQTRSVLTRPWCIAELVTAIEAGVPIIGVAIVSGTTPYDYDVAAKFMAHLDTTLDADAQAKLSAIGIDVTDAAYLLASTLPNMISVPLNMNESRNVLSARIDDIVAGMGKAVLPALPDKAAWLASRGTAGAHGRPTHGWTSGATGAQPSRPPAALPLEVPTLPDSAVGRPEIIAALKANILQAHGEAKAGSAAPETTVTAPPPMKKGGSGIGGFFSGLTTATTATGMGGVGKTLTAAALIRDDEVRLSLE